VRQLEALVRRHRLTDEDGRRLAVLAQLIAHDRAAPTKVRDPRAVIDDHLADSLVALECEPVRSARAIADLGAGAGFPGLPLAIALPESHVSLIESSRRKCAFLTSAVAACAARNVTVVNTRAEAWREGIGRFDLVTARALAPLAVVVEYAAPLLAPGGALVVWRGRRDLEAERAAEYAAQELGLEPSGPITVKPYPSAEHRHLHLMFKVRETPPRFPRGPGIAAKRPLGTRRHDQARRAAGT
jgi:16S rRNA (guanine527-N7)-methyltransferase